MCLVSLYLWPIDRDPGVNVYAHLNQAAAVVVDGTLAIDRFASRPESITIDWSRAPDGRLYPAKAPGAGLAAVPAFFALYHAERAAGIDPLTRQWFRRNAVAINWLLNAVIAAFAILLLVRIGEALGVGRDASRVGALAIAIGTAFYPYATIYYAHVPAACALVITARTCCSRVKLAGRGTSRRGFSQALPSCTTILPPWRSCLSRRPWCSRSRAGSSASFWAGWGPPPFLRRIIRWRSAALLRRRMRIRIPNSSAETDFFAAPESTGTRLFTHRPLSRAFPIFPSPDCRRLRRVPRVPRPGGERSTTGHPAPDLHRSAAGTLVLWLLLNASYTVWWGGFTPGPRFLIPAFVLLAPLIGIGLQRFPRIGFTLFLISSANYFAITAVAILVDELVASPLTQVIYPLFVQGDFQRSNVGMFLGLAPHWSIVVPGCVMTLLLWISWGLLAASRQRKPLNKEDAITA